MKPRPILWTLWMLVLLPVPGGSGLAQTLETRLQAQRPVSEIREPAPLALSLRLSDALTVTPAVDEASAADDAMPLVVDLVVNGVPRGEGLAFRSERLGFLLPVTWLEQFAIVPAQAPRVEDGGDILLVLNQLEGAQTRFDERLLMLELMLPPELYELRRFSLAPELPEFSTASERSALFDYRLDYRGIEGGEARLTLTSELGLRVDGWLLQNRSVHFRDIETKGRAATADNIRFETALLYDERESMRRWIIGDTFITGDELGGSLPIGGFTLRRDFRLVPGFAPQPTLNFSGVAELPSEVEFFLGDNRIFRELVGPGAFEIGDFQYFGGQRDVRVVVRDALGREQVVEMPFNFSDQGLRPGLHDYRYHIGLLRQQLGVRNAAYRGLAAAFQHQVGYNEHLTLGLRGEAGRGVLNLGPSVILRTDRWGLLAVTSGIGWTREEAPGVAYSARYSYQRNPLALTAFARGFGEHYPVLSADRAPPLPVRDLGTALSVALPRVGSINLAYSRSRRREAPDRSIRGISLSRTVFQRLNLALGWRRFDPGDDLFTLSLLYLSADGGGGGLNWQRDASGNEMTRAQYSSRQDPNERFGYRVALQRQGREGVSSNSIAPELRYNGRYTQLIAEAEYTEGAVSPGTRFAMGVAGSAAYADGALAFSRPISDSFAIARIEPPLEGIQVYQANQVIGRTDSNGRILLPTVTSFIDNVVRLEHRDIPLSYSVESAEASFSPPFRSGTVVTFHVRPVRSVSGVLSRYVDGEARPLEYAVVSLPAGSGHNGFNTGRGGAFYLEDVTPGIYEAHTTVGGVSCTFTFEVHDQGEAYVEVDAIANCDTAPP